MKRWTSRVIKISLGEAIHPPTEIMKMVAKQLQFKHFRNWGNNSPIRKQ